jgi:hypothetical protein
LQFLDSFEQVKRSSLVTKFETLYLYYYLFILILLIYMYLYITKDLFFYVLPTISHQFRILFHSFSQVAFIHSILILIMVSSGIHLFYLNSHWFQCGQAGIPAAVLGMKQRIADTTALVSTRRNVVWTFNSMIFPYFHPISKYLCNILEYVTISLTI